MTEEDKELELLKAKRLREMQKKYQRTTKTRRPKGTETFFTRRSFSKGNSYKQLGYRGLEVLQNAETISNETQLVVAKLAELFSVRRGYRNN